VATCQNDYKWIQFMQFELEQFDRRSGRTGALYDAGSDVAELLLNVRYAFCFRLLIKRKKRW